MNKLLIFLSSLLTVSLEAAVITNWGAQVVNAVPNSGDIILMQQGGILRYFTPSQLATNLSTNTLLLSIISSGSATNKVADLNGAATNTAFHGTILMNSNGLVVTNITTAVGRIGIGTVPTNTQYTLQIRSPYGGQVGGGLLIDNETNSDMRGAITLRAGSTVQGRRYIFFQDIDPSLGILLGANEASQFILFNGYGHQLLAETGSNANTIVNAMGNGLLQFNTGGGVGGGTNGVVFYDGNISGGVRQFSMDHSGNTAWIGLPFTALSADGADQTQIVTSNTVGGFIRSSDALTFEVTGNKMAVMSNGMLTVRSTVPSSTVLTLDGQGVVGLAGAHSTDYGLTINSGSFGGSDGYLSFKVGAGATEYGRINVNDGGTMRIIALATLEVLTPLFVVTNNITVLGTTNQVIFGATNIAPSSAVAPTKWVSVQVTGDAGVYRLPLYE